MDRVGICLVILGFFFINLTILQDSLRQNFAFGSFGLASLLALFKLEKNFRTFKIPKSFIFGLLLCIYFIIYSHFVPPYEEYGNNKLLYLLIVTIWGFMLFPIFFRKTDNLDFFCKLLAFISVIFCFLSIFFADPSAGRTGGTGLNPAILARMCMICGIYSAVNIYYKGVSSINIAVLFLSIVAVFFTATKTPVPVFLASFYIVLWKNFSIRQISKHVLVVSLMLVAAYIALLYFVPSQYSNRILDPEGLSYENQSTEGNRMDLYSLSIELISRNPFGYGLGGFAKFHRFIVVPHNIFFEFAIEFGVIPLLVFLVWVKRNLVSSINIPINSPASTFIAVLFIYNLISFLFGGEITIQCLLFYLTGNIIWQLNPKKK